MELKYYAIYKPFGMISQFSASGEKPTLAELDIPEKDVYPVGRLDTDSEGLLILTNDKRVNGLLLDPKHKHWRTYLVQVDGAITPDAIDELNGGMDIKINKKPYHTAPARCKILNSAPKLPDRIPPIRIRKAIPAPWIEMKLTEGKNRQVRKMTAGVGFPTLRLVRYGIEDLTIENMKAGDICELRVHEISKKLKIPIIT